MAELIAAIANWAHHPLGFSLVVLVVIFLGRALYFHLRYRFLWNVEQRWQEYIYEEDSTYSNPRNRWLEERTRKVMQMVEDAGTTPSDVSVMNPVGFGYVQGATLNPLNNWLVKNPEIGPRVRTALIRAQGYYKDERNKNLNPLGWIEYLVFLPRHVVSSIDPRIPKWVKDAIQITYWLVVGAVAIYKVATGRP